METILPHHRRPAARSSDLSGNVLLVATVAIGAAVVESALVPGILLGSAAWLAPRVFSKLRRSPRYAGAFRTPEQEDAQTPAKRSHDHFGWRNSLITISAAKTVTFRVLSSGLDFGWNYLVLGEIGAAAGLSGFSLIAAPTFYFLHETLWSRVQSNAAGDAKGQGTFQIPSEIGGMKVSKAMAKTVTFRLFATASEFGVNYFVARDLLVATKLSAFSIVAGPFVYLAHERAWERYEASRLKPVARRTQQSLPAPSARLAT